jgi:hypothetical protein
MALFVFYCIPPTEISAFNARRYTNIPVKEMYVTCFLPVHFLYCICSFTVLFLYCTCLFTVLYLFTTCFVRVLYLFISCSAYTGMHIAGLDSGGNRATMDCIGRELLDLWENPIKGKDAKMYIVAALCFNFDTKAYEKIMGVQASASYKGCVFCEGNLGKMVDKTMCYPCHRVFLSNNHPYRNQSRRDTYENQKPFFPTCERRPTPRHMTSAEYLANGAEARVQGEPVNGVKVEWPLGILPYHEHIAVEVSRIFDVVLFVYFLYNMFSYCSMPVYYMFFTCILNVFLLFYTCSTPVHFMFVTLF